MIYLPHCSKKYVEKTSIESYANQCWLVIINEVVRYEAEDNLLYQKALESFWKETVLCY